MLFKHFITNTIYNTTSKKKLEIKQLFEHLSFKTIYRSLCTIYYILFAHILSKII